MGLFNREKKSESAVSLAYKLGKLWVRYQLKSQRLGEVRKENRELRLRNTTLEARLAELEMSMSKAAIASAAE